MTPQIESAVDTFIAAIHADLLARVNGNLNGSPSARRTVAKIGKQAREQSGPFALPAKKPRKKMPIQFCPVPRCKDRAAPVFGMLCAKHKATPKKLVAKYRAARRAKKAA